ncbi:TPA: hypothetical protein SAS43_000498 [Campylobacter jejuni]|nr:hypothetical protein [Campylobacter jejuni]
MKIFVYSAFGVVLKDFIEAVVIELKPPLESLEKKILKRFLNDLHAEWKKFGKR